MNIEFRLARDSDIEVLFGLRNEINTRKSSLNSNYFTFDEHVIWFKSRIRNLDSEPILIFLLGGEIIGTTRLDSINYLNQSAHKISITLRTDFRGKGFGTQILSETCLYAQNTLPSKILIAFVKKENTESISIFHKYGFEIVKTKNQLVEFRKILQ